MSDINMTKEELVRQLTEIRATLAEEMKKNQEPKSEELDKLKDQNARLEYRIKHLLRALEEQDKEIEELKKQIKN
ncbi:hypothetical protein KM1_018610 [Entamoeba histolytica HM-3:IMSS]|uniref:Seven tm domain protein n=6 Tax=Entamoeba TaxID=5758 RepID=A0A175JIM0_ENTHI|nr:hypothetical protein ENU1_164120 [Entamoeba nuttalli P19]EKE38504.1 hypothetical protein ENU1_164120 [Entamoeba nuttalli P19]EMS12141.1 hypothetical protein KM1_018610 [Entamoeba histolytica HM-3:IMSS]ENY65208.1 unknown protein, putative [Entamoeba histolytica HM-1:IMSS-A]GAT93263.1 seven tm domain protein [Entamoeba histolytica]|eukprot:XP_008859156.1 hypothetical protein ENU1_164120 [Entamoeba nuttalli P19]